MATASESPVPPVVQGGDVRSFLIADVRGYTAFTLEHGDEAAARLAGRFADIVEDVIPTRDGQVIELRGDEALAVFGSARQAIRASVDLQQRLREEMATDPTLPLKVGIGLDAGEAVPVKGGFRGAALNMAARLCSLAGPGEVLASDGVVHLARKVDGIEYAERGVVPLKGFADPVRVLFVRAAGSPEAQGIDLSSAEGAVPTGFAGPGSAQSLPIGGFLGALPSTALVARAEELTSLLAAVDAAAGGTGRLVLISGEPGVGKTRLAQEVTLKLRNREFVIAAGRCYEAHQTVAYYPFVEALTAAYAAAPPAIQAEMPRTWSDLARLLPALGLPSADAAGGQDQQRLFWAVTGFLQALAAQRPVALMLDDLHWADATSLDLLQHLARHTRSDPVFLLGTFRDVEVSRQHPLESALRDLRREGLVERVDLSRLEEGETAALMAASMGEEEISDEFAELVHQRTEGNPFFVQQVMRVLVERGDVFRRGERWGRKQIEEIEVPESIRSVVGQRLSRLPQPTQEVLYEASVLGQTFGFDDLEAMTEHSEREIEEALAEAARAGLVRESNRDAYSFDHALTQQSLYGELTTRRRRRLHLAAGEAIESLPAKKREGRAAELAWHFLEADEPERALPWSLAAGDGATAVFAYSDAELHFRTAVELARELEDVEAEAAALEKLGETLLGLARLDEAIEVLEGAARLYERLDDLEGEMRAVAHVGAAHSERRTRREGIERLRRTLSRAPDTPSPALVSLQVELARLYFYERLLNEALALAEAAAMTARQLGDDRLLGQAQARRASSLAGVSRFDEALEGYLEAIALAERTGDLVTLVIALNNVGLEYERRSRWEDADVARERQLEIARRSGAPAGVAWTLFIIGSISRAQGKLQRAHSALEEAARICRSIGPNRSSAAIAGEAAVRLLLGGETALDDLEEIAASDVALRIDAQMELAEWDLLHNRPEEAFRRLDIPERLSVEPQSRWMYDRLLAHALAWLGRIDEAEAMALAGVEEGRERGRTPVENSWIVSLIVVRVAQGRIPEARELRDTVVAHTFEAGVPMIRAQAQLRFGTSLVRAGHGAMAREPLEAALSLFREIGAPPLVRRVEELLGGVDP